MRNLVVFIICLLLNAQAYGQDIPAGPQGQPAQQGMSADDIEKELAKEAAQQEVERGRLAEKIEMQRGFYVASDFGVFMTFGGTRGYSNAQPYIGLLLGYDLMRHLSIQLTLGNGFVSANGPGERDATSIDGYAQVDAIPDYGMLNMGAQLVGNFRILERVAIELEAGGGFSRISPLPRSLRPDGDPAKEVGLFPHISGGLSIKYLTLLTDFIAGIDATFYYVLPDGIPAISISPTVRYTF